MSVYKILEQLANEPGKNAKIAILQANKNNKDLMEVCRLAYDPTLNFFLKQIPETKKNDGTVSLQTALHRMERDIAGRVYTGNEAREFLKINLEALTDEDASVLARVIGRDLRAGFNDSTINKVWKDLIPEFPYMRCSLPKAVKLDEYSWKQGVYSQLKADGMYANFDVTADGEVIIASRSGSIFPVEKFSKLVDVAKQILKRDTQTHGELLVKRNGAILPRQIGNGILNSVLKGGEFGPNEEPVYEVWDQIARSSVKSKGVYNFPYSQRYAALLSQLEAQDTFSLLKNGAAIQMIETKIVHSYEEALEHYFEKLGQKFEGTIIKCGTGVWKDGTSKHQCKMKLETIVDLVIVGFNYGKGKNADTFGSIVCQSSCGELEVSVSGFSDADRINIWANKDEIIGKIMAVKSNNLMKPSASNSKYSLFLPRCEEIRNDKHVADDLQRIKDQFESAIKN